MGLRQTLREPLVHFVLIGALLFLVHGWAAPADEASKRIVVSQDRVNAMAREYREQLGVSPTAEQLRKLVDTYVHDEILYREGTAEGLGRDDAVIRRRVVQKYQILLEETATQAGATEAELSSYLKAHAADFTAPGTVTFDQVFFDVSNSGPEVEWAFERAKRAAIGGANPATLGEDSMLPRHVEAAPLDRVALDFGPDFAAALAAAPLGRWLGPVPSGYGAHLVRVTARAPASLPPLDAVRPMVARAWETERRRRALDASYRKARGQYDVAIKATMSPQLASRE